MRLSLIPKERQFFVLFRENAATLMESLRTLDALLHSSAEQFTMHLERLQDLEHQADEITHRISQELNRTFITPFDREDIYALAGAVDDVIDLAEETADTILLDCIDTITPAAQRMGEILVKIGQELVHLFDQLEAGKDLQGCWVRINELENEADTVTRQAIGDLFRQDGDPISVIKWKDVYALLERTVDRSEDVASIIETVMIKNA